MTELVVVWNGSFKDVYLCIPPVDFGRMKTAMPERIDRTVPKADYRRERALVLAMLGSRPFWKTKELCEAVGMDSRMVSGFISHWINSGTIARVGFGSYRLVARPISTEEIER